MINLDSLLHYFWIVACIIFFALWRWEAYHTRMALRIADTSTSNAAACIAEYSAAADSIGEAVRGLRREQ